MKIKMTIIALIVALSCGSAQAAKFIVFGVDRTEGYKVITETGIYIATEYVKQAMPGKQAKPGDEIFVRWISDQSYRPDQVIAHLKMPTDNRPKKTGRYDKKRARQREAAFNKLKSKVFALKTKTLQALHSPCVGATKRTDIFGFVAAASEQFAILPPDTEKELILATDLGDNRNYETDIDLQGAKVLIYLLHTSANPAKVKALRDRWSAMFKKWKASNIEFRWPTTEQIHWRNQACTR